jgi:type I restriction enzyme M protein
MQHIQILAVVSLPQTSFTHFGAGVKSSLVFMRRKGEGEELGDYPIFMAIADYIGYDATGRDIPQNDLPEILERYLKFEKGLRWKFLLYIEMTL